MSVQTPEIKKARVPFAEIIEAQIYKHEVKSEGTNRFCPAAFEVLHVAAFVSEEPISCTSREEKWYESDANIKLTR